MLANSLINIAQLTMRQPEHVQVNLLCQHPLNRIRQE
jgi:hypothetical protein